ncbi:MAG: glycosyltransferase family 4 protein [Rhodospirillales bacterium]|nr:glycosyltransferase family 4 protein [Rhodospirillales bacterium]
MTVALATSSSLPALGGAEVGLHNIASGLLELGHRPVLITSFAHARALDRDGWRLPYDVVPYPPRILTWRAGGRWIAGGLLRMFHGRLQRRYRFDVWHATVGFPVGASVVEFCRPCRIPHLVRCTGEDIQVRRDISYGIRLDPRLDGEIRYWLPQAQRLVAITETVANEYDAIGVDSARILRIPNGVDLPRFRNHWPRVDLRRTMGIPKDAVVFLALGRFHQKKNFAQVIAAASKLQKRVEKPFRVVIAGTGTGKLASIVETAGMRDMVKLYEPYRGADRSREARLPDDEVLDLYSMADVFVMPSLIETFGIVMGEAMAAGLPLIVADSPGCRDVVASGRFGCLYDGSTGGLADAMAQLRRKEDRDAWAAKSHQRAEEFNWTNVVRCYANAYGQMIEEYRDR